MPHVKRPLSRRAALARLARCAVAAAAAAPGALPPAATKAQEVQPPLLPPPLPETAPGDGTPKAADPAAPPAAQMAGEAIDETEGYANWKHHIGTPDEAVCYVRVTVFDGSGVNGSGQTTREGTGVVVRCDGFVMLPEALFGDDRVLQKTAKISLRFRAADGPPPADPIPAVAAPRFHSPKTDYVLVKVNGHHFKGLHLLDARNLKVGMLVSVVWAAAPKDKAAPLARTREAVVGTRQPGSSVPHFPLTFGDPANAAAAAEAERPPLGAAVIEPSCGALLGVVTVSDAAKGVQFSPFGFFQYISNDVGLKVSPDDVTLTGAIRSEDVSSTGQMLTMVKVAGGPTHLTGEIANNYRYFYGTDVVCMPDFFIDAHPVTIGTYRDWISRAAAPRKPMGWMDNNEVRSRQRNPDLPVTGLIADDGLRYAAAHNKRLPTPVEWARASIGADTDWMSKLWDIWQGISSSQIKISLDKIAVYGETMHELAKEKLQRKDRNIVLPSAITSPELDMINREQMQIYQNYWAVRDRWFPFQHSPVGFYKKDVSRWKVGEVVGNAPEMCQPNYAFRALEPVQKPFATFADPYASRSILFGWFANCFPGDVDANFTVFAAAPTVVRSYVFHRDGLYSIGSMNAAAATGCGFRCAL